jgi:hypothetical protein
MAFYNEAWFIHQVTDAVHHASQQRKAKTTGTTIRKDGVVGKTVPFNVLSSFEMEEMMSRDGDTQYLNPDQSKRRAVLRDFAAAITIDSFDVVKELANAESEFTMGLAFARNRREDRMVLSVPGRVAAGTAGTGVGGAIGKASTVDEGAETSSTSDLPAAQQIVNGGTNLTMAKVRAARALFDAADADEEDQYFFASPSGIAKLLTDSTVTSSDYSTLQALSQGRLGPDILWMGFKWRTSTLLPKTGNIRQCIAYQKRGVGYATSSVKALETGLDPGKWNNPFVMAKFSGAAVRIDDNLVVQCDIDETA